MAAVLGILLALSLAVPALAAEPVFEKYKVPTVDGAEVNVEVMRPAGDAHAPVILTYSPYNTLSEGTTPNLANDDLGQRYLERGYARAVADVLGTRDSSGCWDYGGPKEQQSGVDVVNFLSRQPWSSGRVAMIGGSYDGTTANMVAARGDDAPGLVAIVPIAAISRWYGYAYSHGVRYFLNSEVPTDEGIDTPLAFDFGLARTPPTDPTDPKLVEKLVSRLNPCDSAEHTARGYDRTPDYDDFWLERDYRKDAANFRAAVLMAHGWLDWNVKQEEGVGLYEALPEDDPATAAVEGVPFKRLYMFQDSHASPSAANWQPLLDRFFEHTLEGVDNGVDREPPVLTEGRSADGPEPFHAESSWPPAGTDPLTFYLTRTATGGALATQPAAAPDATYTDLSTTTEELSKEQPEAEAGWLYYASAPLDRDVRLAGTPSLRAALSVDRDGGHLTPVLVDVAPDGSLGTVSRGFLNLRYREGLARAQPVPVMAPFQATADMGPQDYTFRKGHRVGLLVQSSNTVWALPDDPGTRVTVHHGADGSRLTLPVAP
jgi:X-Pro dipeptidyl-peptidase